MIQTQATHILEHVCKQLISNRLTKLNANNNEINTNANNGIIIFFTIIYYF